MKFYTLEEMADKHIGKRGTPEREAFEADVEAALIVEALMSQNFIENEKQYQIALKRVEELMLGLPEDTPEDDPQMVELTLLGNLVADYDEEHYPIGKPSLIEVIKLRMYEMGLTQSALSKLLGINPARVCEYLSGKREPTLNQARTISQKLNIDPAIVLGV